MSCITTPIIKPLSMANTCLISLPAIFTPKTSYPFLSIPSKPITLHLSSSHSSFSLTHKTRFSKLVSLVAEEDKTAVIEEEEVSWKNSGVGESGGWEVGSEDEGGAVGDATESGGEDGFVELPEEAKVFVGNLPYDVDSEKLAEIFNRAGVVEISEVIYNRETSQSRGFAFVTMSTVEEAEKAVDMFHRYDINGRLLTVNKAAPKGSRPERTPRAFEKNYRIYVGNLPWDVDNAGLEQVFSEHGKVVDARVVYDRESGRSRGFGFVTMSTEAELNDAIANLDGQDMGGRALRVNAAEERPRRAF